MHRKSLIFWSWTTKLSLVAIAFLTVLWIVSSWIFWQEGWNNLIEPVLGLVEAIGLPLTLLAVVSWIIPDYHAVAFFAEIDGENGKEKRWLNYRPVWSNRKDLALFCQSECGRLFGKNVQPADAMMPRIPERILYDVALVPRKTRAMGDYWIIPVRLEPAGVKFISENREKIGVSKQESLWVDEVLTCTRFPWTQTWGNDPDGGGARR